MQAVDTQRLKGRILYKIFTNLYLVIVPIIYSSAHISPREENISDQYGGGR